MMQSTLLTKYNTVPRRVYINTKTGKQSIWLEDVLEEDVYVNRTLDCIKREPGGPFKKTMFGNIELVPHTKIMSAETGKLFTLPRDIILEKEEMIQRLIQLFSDAVEAEWNPEKFHIVLHSSGFDSRILSETIRNLWKKNGDAWLGDVLFVSSRWEAGGFRQIMKLQGWDKSQYHVVGEKLHVPDYHEISLDFDTAWKRLNCIFGLPVNLFYYLIESTQVDGLAPSDDTEIQSWTKYLLPVDYTVVADLMKKYMFTYYHALGGRNYKGENMEFPGAHPIFISGARRFRNKLRYGHAKREMVRAMNPKLFEIKNQNLHSNNADYNRMISGRLMRDIVHDYKSSWYGSRVKAIPTNIVGFTLWWRRWSVASFCEHLIRSGKNLRMV